jgi:hypothetical protein
MIYELLIPKLTTALAVFQPEHDWDPDNGTAYISITQHHFLQLNGGNTEYGCCSVQLIRQDKMQHDIKTPEGIAAFAIKDRSNCKSSPYYTLIHFDTRRFYGDIDLFVHLIAQSVEGFVPLPQLSYELK